MSLIEKKHVDFLRSVLRGGRVGLSDREADRTRQFCRRNGFVEVLKNPRRWSLTDKGRSLVDVWNEDERTNRG